MSTYNIRGKLGMQIFESFAAISKSMHDHSDKINLVVNTGDGSDPGFHNRLKDLFLYTEAFTITEQPGFGKQSVWSGDQMRYAFENRAKIATLFRLPTVWAQAGGPQQWDNVLHIRGLDKQVAQANSYAKAALLFGRAEGDNVIIGDDPKMIGSVVMHLELNKGLYGDLHYSVSDENDINDWLTVYYAKEVWGPMSSFTLSTLLFEPDKKINILHRDINNGSFLLTDDNYRAIEVLMEFCKNVKWMN